MHDIGAKFSHFSLFFTWTFYFFFKKIIFLIFLINSCFLQPLILTIDNNYISWRSLSFTGMIIAKAAAFDLRYAGTNITMHDIYFSKGGGARILRTVLGCINIYIPYRWLVYYKELVPNGEQRSSKTIPKGKYVHFKNSFFFFT